MAIIYLGNPSAVLHDVVYAWELANPLIERGKGRTTPDRFIERNRFNSRRGQDVLDLAGRQERAPRLEYKRKKHRAGSSSILQDLCRLRPVLRKFQSIPSRHFRANCRKDVVVPYRYNASP